MSAQINHDDEFVDGDLHSAADADAIDEHDLVDHHPAAEVDDDAADAEVDDENVDPLSLPAAPAPPIDTRYIPLEDIAERGNIRKTHGLRQLAETMHLDGQLMPVLVRPAPEDADHGKPFELIFGHRRKMAAELLHWETLRAEVRDVPDVERLVQMFVENYQREDLSAVEEAYTMLQLREEMGWSQARIARELGCDPSHVSHRLSLLKLAAPTPPAPPPVPTIHYDNNVELAEDAEETSAAADNTATNALPAAADETSAGDERKSVDILGLIDQGKLSPSAAEVIAGLDDRAEQEKVASLASRYDWKVKEVEKYVRKMKAHEVVEGPDEMGPVEMVTMDDAVELRRLPLRDLTPGEYARINLFALLRNGMDQEMLEYLADVMGYSYDYLWSYVSALDDDQVSELSDLMLRRYISAAHRFHDLPPELVDTMSLPEGATDEATAQALEAAKLTLPGAFES